MQVQKKAVFSPNGEYFAFADGQGLLKIWDTSSNIVKKQHALHSSVNFVCSSLTWGPSIEKNSKENSDDIRPLEHQCLIIGTETGEVLLYDLIADKFCSLFVTSHSDAVTDLCWYADTNSLFSCSKDQSIAIWDVVSGKLISKWQADDEPLHSICVIDSNNMLSASTSILWWNIEEQTVIKKFSGHDSQILTLLPAISTDKSSNSYFLSVAGGESKISAWRLHAKNSVNAVASFNLPDDLLGIDVTRFFSKENPLLLSAVMKSGALLLFKHVLNGRTRKNLMPQSTLCITSKPTGNTTKSSSIPIIASKFTDNSSSCVVAYGDIENPVFEKVNIEDCPKNLTLSRDKHVVQNNSPEISQVKIYNKLGEYISANGNVSSLSSLHSSPKRRKQKDPDENFDSSQAEKLTNHNDLSEEHDEMPNMSTSKKKPQRKVLPVKNYKIKKETILSDPTNMANSLVQGLQTENRALLNMVLLCSDDRLIRESVVLLPLECLKSLLTEIHSKLINPEERSIYSSRKWLKEILSNNIEYLRNCQELQNILNQLKDFIDQQRVSDTLTKLSKLKGLLHLQRIQLSSINCDSSDSDTQESMET
ncbi:hypothetical protein JTE90_024018 [Oedothorax gibbosus]|uniref:WD repeat-containing protein 43 n=1 Tax=Oedothorax gibbosus TaxID=931172 RepID=A0AAV6VCE8_9ARAC|nr:hypothetical protein JTE90_024018 [Oedothorax gibbosus]